MQRFKEVLQDTRDVFSTKWIVSELRVPAWAIHAFLYITLLRSLSYGIELIFIVTNNSITPLMAFAAIFGIQLWGFLMLAAALIFIIGVITKRTIILTIGTLLCAAVWTGFSLCLGFGWMGTGTGGRFFIAAAATAATWIVFFGTHLQTIRKNGVGRREKD